jgi:predicted transcriptional regulator
MIKEQSKVSMQRLPGVPAGGIRTVGQIRGTNNLTFHAGQNGMAVAIELLSSHTPGAPVLDDQNEFIGFVSEFDVLRALEAGKDLAEMTVDQIMAQDRIAVMSETTIEEAVKLMEEKRLLNLPVKKNGKVAYSVTRHDLLRAWIGLGTSGED